jgi:hypothetical protein
LIALLESNLGDDDCSVFKRTSSGAVLEQITRSRISA